MRRSNSWNTHLDCKGNLDIMKRYITSYGIHKNYRDNWKNCVTYMLYPRISFKIFHGHPNDWEIVGQTTNSGMLLEQFTGGGVGCVMIMIDADADD